MLSSVVVYNKAWTEETLDCLCKEIKRITELRDQLMYAYELVIPERAVAIAQINREVERLDNSLRTTLHAIQEFRESSERNIQKNIAEYAEAADMAVRIFD